MGGRRGEESRGEERRGEEVARELARRVLAGSGWLVQSHSGLVWGVVPAASCPVAGRWRKAGGVFVLWW
eukprot:COSAG02_NODE_9607_length_2162_cov_4.068996_2_plen_69_part_00